MLIACPECGKMISDQAVLCPQCGLNFPHVGRERLAEEYYKRGNYAIGVHYITRSSEYAVCRKHWLFSKPKRLTISEVKVAKHKNGCQYKAHGWYAVVYCNCPSCGEQARYSECPSCEP